MIKEIITLFDIGDTVWAMLYLENLDKKHSYDMKLVQRKIRSISYIYNGPEEIVSYLIEGFNEWLNEPTENPEEKSRLWYIGEQIFLDEDQAKKAYDLYNEEGGSPEDF